jgi:hypothetical protein
VRRDYLSDIEEQTAFLAKRIARVNKLMAA